MSYFFSHILLHLTRCVPPTIPRRLHFIIYPLDANIPEDRDSLIPMHRLKFRQDSDQMVRRSLRLAGGHGGAGWVRKAK